jgi:hypothetical protein
MSYREGLRREVVDSHDASRAGLFGECTRLSTARVNVLQTSVMQAGISARRTESRQNVSMLHLNGRRQG